MQNYDYNTHVMFSHYNILYNLCPTAVRKPHLYYVNVHDTNIIIHYNIIVRNSDNYDIFRRVVSILYVIILYLNNCDRHRRWKISERSTVSNTRRARSWPMCD